MLVTDDNIIELVSITYHKQLTVDSDKFNIDNHGMLLQRLKIDKLYVKPARQLMGVLKYLDPATTIYIKRPLDIKNYKIDEMIHHHTKTRGTVYTLDCIEYYIEFNDKLYTVKYLNLLCY